jgi:hypothetical protein
MVHRVMMGRRERRVIMEILDHKVLREMMELMV